MNARSSLFAVVTALIAAPSISLAQRAPYARPDELAPEGLSHQLDLSMRLGYARVLDPQRVAGMTNQGAFSLRTRALIGRRVAWCGGLDGELGGAESGLVYGVALHALGLAGRFNGAHFKLLGVLLEQLIGHVSYGSLCAQRVLAALHTKRDHDLALPKRQRIGKRALDPFHQKADVALQQANLWRHLQGDRAGKL